jgi:hypothetical protein
VDGGTLERGEADAIVAARVERLGPEARDQVAAVTAEAE